MTPKEKAEELFNKMINVSREIERIDAKECALIAIQEIIGVLNEISISESGTTQIDYGQTYWEQVKNKIENL